MESSSVILAVLILIPVLMMTAVLEKRMRNVVLFFSFGIFFAFFAGEIDGFILSASGVSVKFAAENITPITEEFLKALPIVVYAFLFHPSKEKLISAAVAVGIGFSLFENVFLFLQAGNVNLLWALMRGLGSGMMHSVCTLAIGDVMSEIIEKRVLFFPGTLAALSSSVIYHSVYNIVIQSKYGIFGFLLPIFTYIPFLIVTGIKAKKAPDTERKTTND